MPSKRVSLKGKGADLFFGGEQPVATESTQSENEQDISPPAPTISDQKAAQASVEPLEQASTEDPEVATRPERTRSRQTSNNGSSVASRDMSPPYGQNPKEVVQQESKHASTLASIDTETIDSIRKTVKVIGRDVSFVRLSAEEKRRLAGIVFTYKMQGIKTSENEINRIAINLLLEDYEQNGEESVLAKVLAALQA